MVFTFGNVTVDIDVEMTRSYYAKEPTVRHTCRCNGCQNYDDVILTAPESVLSFFKQLGLDPQKPTEVFGLWLTPENGQYLYGGWIHVVGRLLTNGNSVQPETAYRPSPEYECLVWFTDDKSKFGPVKKDFPTPILELPFQIRLPWLLNETEKRL